MNPVIQEYHIYNHLKKDIYLYCMGKKGGSLFPDCNRIGVFLRCRLDGRKVVIEIIIPFKHETT